MASEFYVPGAERARRVNALFTRIADRYDLINDLQSLWLHRLWKKQLVQMARVQAGSRVCDVCCGTGDLAHEFARQRAHVIGVDFTESMLARAKHRLEQSSGADLAPSVTLVRGDAQRLPFPSDTFDAVSVGYGLRNLSDWREGLREMVRVCKPGGRVLVLDFGKPRNPLWRLVFYTYLRCFVPVLGLLVCGSASAYSYILESLRSYPAQQGVEAEMRSLLLENVRTRNILGGVMSINFAQKPVGASIGQTSLGGTRAVQDAGAR